MTDVTQESPDLSEKGGASVPSSAEDARFWSLEKQVIFEEPDEAIPPQHLPLRHAQRRSSHTQASRQSQGPNHPSQTPPRQSQGPNRSSQIPPRQSQGPNHPSQTPPRQSQGPNHPSQTPPRPSQGPNHPSQTPPRQSQGPNRSSQIPPRPSQGPNHPSQIPPRPSQGPNRSSVHPSRQSHRPHQSSQFHSKLMRISISAAETISYNSGRPHRSDTTAFRNKSPSCYYDQVREIEESFVSKLSCTEKVNAWKTRAKSTVTEKENVTLQMDSDLKTEDFVTPTSERKASKELFSSMLEEDLLLPKKDTSPTKKDISSPTKKDTFMTKKKNIFLPKKDISSPTKKDTSSTKDTSLTKKVGRQRTKKRGKWSAGLQGRSADQKRMLTMSASLGLPHPVDMPAVAFPLMRKSVNRLTVREMALLVDLGQASESHVVRFYVEWAADLQDDSDVCFFIDTVDLYGRHLRAEIGNLYDAFPHHLIIRQTRGRRKADGAVVVLTVSCAFADQWGSIVMDKEVERVKEYVIQDKERVPLPGDWRALIQVTHVSRIRLRREERRRQARLYEIERKLRVRQRSTMLR